MSLTQLSQEVFDLFDRIILLGDGHVVFQGPQQDAVPYFTNLGLVRNDIISALSGQLMAAYMLIQSFYFNNIIQHTIDNQHNFLNIQIHEAIICRV